MFSSFSKRASFKNRGASRRRILRLEYLERRLALAPVTVTITRVVEIDHPDNDVFSVAGDYFGKVFIDGALAGTSPTFSVDPGFLGAASLASRPLLSIPTGRLRPMLIQGRASQRLIFSYGTKMAFE